MHLRGRLVINATALWVATEIAPGISFTGDRWLLFAVALVFGVLNVAVRPILLICATISSWTKPVSQSTAAVRLATEEEIVGLYPGCEPGAMPPFGPLYGQRVFVDSSLVAEPDFVFNAGTHTDAIRMRYSDFADLTKPHVGGFATRVHH